LKWRNTLESFGIVSILIHWISAVLTLGLFFLGYWMVGLDYYSQWYHKAPNLHQSFGLILIFITLFRVFWVVSNPKPKPLSSKNWQKQLASTVQATMYLSMMTLFGSGYIIATADGSSVYLFDLLSIPAIVTGDAKLVDNLGLIHEYTAYFLMLLILLHVIGAVKHHFIDRNTTLKRMLSTFK
jgi:cytochrome b561